MSAVLPLAVLLLPVVLKNERLIAIPSSMEKASEAVLSLRPVTFRYKTDTKGIPQFGLIAEEVAKVNQALVLPDKEGKPNTVRYDQVNAMLLNEFLKEHRKVEELEKGMEVLTAQLKEQAAQIQKVSAQLEASRVRCKWSRTISKFRARLQVSCRATGRDHIIFA